MISLRQAFACRPCIVSRCRNHGKGYPPTEETGSSLVILIGAVAGGASARGGLRCGGFSLAGEGGVGLKGVLDEGSDDAEFFGAQIFEMIAPVRRRSMVVARWGRHARIILPTNEKGTPPIWVYWRRCRGSAGGRKSSNRRRASRARAPASGGVCGQVQLCNGGRRPGAGAPWRA
jgi:hypothetical protein